MRDQAIKTWVETSRSALVSNVRQIKGALSADASFMAVVKSNAYGHGLEQVAEAVAGDVDWFGVDSLTEAEVVSQVGSAAGGDTPILIIGHTPHSAHDRVVAGGFRQVVYDREAVRSLSAAAGRRGKSAKLHLKVETGTSRQGLPLGELQEFIQWLDDVPHVELEGLYTHYANMEDTTDPTYAMGQLERFREAVSEVGGDQGRTALILHTACSAAVMLYPETHYDLVRVGISLYGLWSSELTREHVKLKGNSVRLTPAMTWKSVIAQVKRLSAGTPVSYGLTETVTRDSCVAVIPVGYWDGYDRKLSSVGNILVRGQRAKVLGRICMNMFVVDVTDIPDASAGDEVVLLGKQGGETISAEELAGKIGTINYEVVTRVNPLLPRFLVD